MSREQAAVAFANLSVRRAAAEPDRAQGAGWGADLAWERCQEQAAIAYAAGDPILPSRLWTEALDLAERHFAHGDPRLATSLTNHALVLRWRRQDHQAQRRFQRALFVWDESWRWIALMTAAWPTPALQRHRDTLAVYNQDDRAHFLALAERGRSATAALMRCEAWTPGTIETWLEIKPRGLSDLRKLLGAVLLISPRPYV